MCRNTHCGFCSSSDVWDPFLFPRIENYCTAGKTQRERKKVQDFIFYNTEKGLLYSSRNLINHSNQCMKYT